jgi:hypothetical protein
MHLYFYFDKYLKFTKLKEKNADFFENYNDGFKVNAVFYGIFQ